jgi:hypothetical protein
MYIHTTTTTTTTTIIIIIHLRKIKRTNEKQKHEKNAYNIQKQDY